MTRVKNTMGTNNSQAIAKDESRYPYSTVLFTLLKLEILLSLMELCFINFLLPWHRSFRYYTVKREITLFAVSKAKQKTSKGNNFYFSPFAFNRSYIRVVIISKRGFFPEAVIYGVKKSELN